MHNKFIDRCGYWSFWDGDQGVSEGYVIVAIFVYFIGPEPVDERELEERLAMLIAPQKTAKPVAHQLPQEQEAFLPWVRQS